MKWYRKAAEQGNADAIRWLKENGYYDQAKAEQMNVAATIPVTYPIVDVPAVQSKSAQSKPTASSAEDFEIKDGVLDK